MGTANNRNLWGGHFRSWEMGLLNGISKDGLKLCPRVEARRGCIFLHGDYLNSKRRDVGGRREIADER